VNVRFGSKAEVTASYFDVGSCLNSRHSSAPHNRSKSAKSRHGYAIEFGATF